MLKTSTPDLWDQHGDQLYCVDPIFHSFGLKDSFQGAITTLKLHEDNSLVHEELKKNGKGKVLVVDGGGSLRCALIGDQLAQLAIDNRWEGLIIFGCIRDTALINKMDIGIRAINSCPVKSTKRNEGQKGLVVKFASTSFTPGHFLYADSDGVLTSKNSY